MANDGYWIILNEYGTQICWSIRDNEDECKDDACSGYDLTWPELLDRGYKCVPCQVETEPGVAWDKEDMLPWLKANVDREGAWPCTVRNPRPGVYQVRFAGIPLKIATYRYCQDCGSEPGFCPMIRDDLWSRLGLDGIICWPCLVGRLGRELQFGDLADTHFNRPLARVMR